MAYRLPPPWDPGYAMPKNALDEGLERRAFITKWQPRGSYDNPQLANRTGYAIPGYVQQEMYGQGARVTQWMPNATAQRVPNYLNQHTRITNVATAGGGSKRVTVVRSAMGDDAVVDDAFPEPWGSYGTKAASAIMAKLAIVPKASRKAMLQKILAAIDSSLWSRTQEATKRYLARGATPPAALQAGLARAMSAGIVAELHRTGKTGKYPGAGQVAMGVRSALGATAAPGAASTLTAGLSSAGTVAVASGQAPVNIPEGACTTSSSGQVFVWHSGAWMPLRVGEQCVSQVGPGYVSDGGFTTTSGSWPLTGGNFFTGPFALTRPIIQQTLGGMSRPELVPSDWKALVSKIGTTDGPKPLSGTGLFDIMAKGTPAQQAAYTAWLAGFGLPAVGPGQFYRVIVPTHRGTDIPDDQSMPVAVFTNPDDGGAAYYIQLTVNVDDSGNVVPTARIVKMPSGGIAMPSWMNTVFNDIGDVLSSIGGLACTAVNAPGAAAGAAKAGGGAAALGVGLASGLCGGPPPPPAPKPSSSSSLLPLAIAGVGLAAVLLVTSAPRKKTTP